jgi:hypothetical protein
MHSVQKINEILLPVLCIIFILIFAGPGIKVSLPVVCIVYCQFLGIILAEQV